MATHAELKKREEEAEKAILANPDKYRGQDGQINYHKIQEQFDLGINRCYKVKFHVETELAKKTPRTHSKKS